MLADLLSVTSRQQSLVESRRRNWVTNDSHEQNSTCSPAAQYCQNCADSLSSRTLPDTATYDIHQQLKFANATGRNPVTWPATKSTVKVFTPLLKCHQRLLIFSHTRHRQKSVQCHLNLFCWNNFTHRTCNKVITRKKPVMIRKEAIDFITKVTLSEVNNKNVSRITESKCFNSM